MLVKQDNIWPASALIKQQDQARC